MPAQPRKAPAKKATAAVAARREVRAEKGKPKPLAVKFRGESFEIPIDRLGSARVYMRQKLLQSTPTAEHQVDLLFEILGGDQSARFIDSCGPGDTIFTVAREFFDAIKKAANVPNS